MRRGQVYFNRAYPHLILKHPWVIASEPNHPSGNVVIVNWSSDPGPTGDETTKLEKGDHSTITHRSYVRYADAKTVKVIQLKQLINRGEYTRSTDADQDLLDAIYVGFAESPHVSPDIRDFLEKQRFIQ